MSYSIVYDKVFLKTSNGNITPVVLSGSNNCTQTSYDSYNRPHEKRCRSWGIFGTFLDIAPIEIMRTITSWEPNEENFMYHGKWVNSAGLERFFENGIENAVTVEELLSSTSDCNSVVCYMITPPATADSFSHVGPSTYCKTTAEFEEWIKHSKNKASQSSGIQLVVGFIGDQKLHRLNIKLNGRVAVKYKSSYISSFSEYEVSYSKEPRAAAIFDSADDAIIKLPNFIKKQSLVFISAETVEKKRMAKHIIQIVNGCYAGYYVVKKVRGKMQMTTYSQNAMRFLSQKTATGYINKELKTAFPSMSFEVDTIK